MSKATSACPRRPTRADAARNREKLLDAAKSAFASGSGASSGASLEAIAREAGVGIGTLYRHFPTREALYEALYRRDIDEVVILGTRLLEADDPLDALRRWLHAAIGMAATKKGMIAGFALSVETTSAISERFSGRLIGAIDPLVVRAVEKGCLPQDTDGEELLLSIIGMCMLRDREGWQAGVKRMVDALLLGLQASVSQASPAGRKPR